MAYRLVFGYAFVRWEFEQNSSLQLFEDQKRGVRAGPPVPGAPGTTRGFIGSRPSRCSFLRASLRARRMASHLCPPKGFPLQRAPKTSSCQPSTNQRLPQFPPQLLCHPPPPRTSLTISNSNNAPMVALMVAEMMPEPRWRPSCGTSQLPMKAPAIPMKRSPRIPNPVPCTIWPASCVYQATMSELGHLLQADLCLNPNI